MKKYIILALTSLLALTSCESFLDRSPLSDLSPSSYFKDKAEMKNWNKLNVKYWTPENHSNEYQQIGAQSYHTQVLGKISGSFLKMQNITLGYTLPENWMKKMKMKNARAYINVQNPFTFTDYLGPDPETIGEDVYKSLSLYPMTFTFGVNLTF